MFRAIALGTGDILLSEDRWRRGDHDIPNEPEKNPRRPESLVLDRDTPSTQWHLRSSDEAHTSG